MLSSWLSDNMNIVHVQNFDSFWSF